MSEKPKLVADPAMSPVEALAMRLYMSDPGGGLGHGAWDAEDTLRPAVKDHFREFAKNLLEPCEKCPPSPLVPQTEVDAVKAQLEEARAPWVSPIGSRERWAGENPEPIPFPREYNDLYRIKADYMRAIECSSSGPTPEERSEKVDAVFRASMDLTYEVTHLRAELTEAKAIAEWLQAEESQAKSYYKDQMESCHREISHLHDKIGQHEVRENAAPSLPAVDSPEDLTPELLGLAADVIIEAHPTACIESPAFGIANELRLIRDRMEREQAEKAKRDKVIDVIAEALVGADHRFDSACYEWHQLDDSTKRRSRQAAADLLDRFDITPKAAGE